MSKKTLILLGHNKIRLKPTILGRLYPFVQEYRDGGIKVVNVPGFFSRGDILVYRSLVSRLAPGSIVIEVGTWKGRSIANVATEGNKDIIFIAVDTFVGSKHERSGAHREATLSKDGIYFKFLRNMLRHRVRNFSVLRMESVQGSSMFHNEIADFIFIDAGHSYDEVREDILSWKPKVKAGDFWRVMTTAIITLLCEQ